MSTPDRLAAVALGCVVAATSSFAHHGSAPHFEMSRDIEIRGTVQRFEARNPHSFVHVDVTDESGHTVAWRCELNSIASIRRLGIDESTFTAGEQIRIVGHPARREAHECFFREAELADGRIVRATESTDRVTAAAKPSVVQDGVLGTWVRKSFAGGGVGAPRILDFLTDEGRAAVAEYDAFRDDPALRCSPVGPTRLWGNPVQPFEIRKEGARIVLAFEFMDAVREVQMDTAEHPAGGPRTVLGHSVGRWDGDMLVLDTANFAPGVVTQYAQTGGDQYAGVLHSDAYHMTERLAIKQNGDLEVTWTHEDPKYFTRAFDGGPVTYERRPDLTVGPYECERDR
jgi:hypothetical protein